MKKLIKINQIWQKSTKIDENQPKSILNNSWLTKNVQNWFWTVLVNFHGCNSKEKHCVKIVQNQPKLTRIVRNWPKLTKIKQNWRKSTKINFVQKTWPRLIASISIPRLHTAPGSPKSFPHLLYQSSEFYLRLQSSCFFCINFISSQ